MSEGAPLLPCQSAAAPEISVWAQVVHALWIAWIKEVEWSERKRDRAWKRRRERRLKVPRVCRRIVLMCSFEVLEVVLCKEYCQHKSQMQTICKSVIFIKCSRLILENVVWSTAMKFSKIAGTLLIFSKRIFCNIFGSWFRGEKKQVNISSLLQQTQGI